MVWGFSSQIKKHLSTYEPFCREDEVEKLKQLLKSKSAGITYASFGISERLAKDQTYPVIQLIDEGETKSDLDFVDTLNHTAYIYFRNEIFKDIGKDAQNRFISFFDSKPTVLSLLLHQFFSTDQFHILLISDKHCHSETLIEILIGLHPLAKVIKTVDGIDLGPIIKGKAKPAMEPGMLQEYAGGLLAFSHLEKFTKTQQERLTEAMDTGAIYKKVSGVTFKPDSNISVLGYTQPNTSVFVGKHVGLFKQQLPVPLDLMEHFHMVVCVNCGKEGCLAPLTYSETDLEFVKEYISYAATKQVVFPKKFDKHVADWHKLVHKKRDKYIPPITKNLAIALIRLAVAHARMHLRDEVTLEDLKFSMDLLQESLSLIRC